MAGDPDGRARWVALVVCCSAMFMTLLDVSVTNVALPSIGRATGAGPSQLQWIVGGYTLAFGLVPVLAGRLGDDHGRRLMFQVGVGGFVVTSAVAGLAPSSSLLIAARVLQGISGGLINPQVSGLVQQMFRGQDRGRAFGYLGTTVGLGTALGPLLGGVLIGLGGPESGWRLVFFINVPIGLAVIVLARRYLPATPAVGRHHLDVIGALVLGLAIFCVLFSVVEYDQLQDARIYWLLMPGALLLLGFFRRERRLTDLRRDPLVDFRLFREPSYTAGTLLALAYFPAFAGIPLVLAIFYQQGLGYTPLQSALGVTAYAVGNAVGAPVAGRVVTRVGRPLVVAAAVTFGLGAAALALVARTAPETHIALSLAGPLFVMGIGSGALITPNQTLTLAAVDPAVGSTAGGVLQTAQRIGLAVGQAVVGAAFFGALSGHSRGAYAAALATAVAVALIFVAVALIVGAVDLVRSRRVTTGPPA
ncbi:MAG TPA: MFS transporter [Kineosporiaceae bacterium]|jgi:EmrB/QacA subfamily drug resistance transporter|nr:MFS transporter [Kineosporiaceae bacterium]